MTEIFGYSVAHKVTGERLKCIGRKAYDGKGPASQALKKAVDMYRRRVQIGYDPELMKAWYGGQNPDEFEVVELCVYAPAE